jgi:tol-pal system protein YbgF
MKRLALVLLIALAAGCSSTRNVDDGPMPAAVPPASIDARLSEVQTSLTELLERIDVLNDRLTRLEQGSTPIATPASSQNPVQPQSEIVAATRPATQQPASKSAPLQRSLQGAQLADNYRAALMLYGRAKFEDARKMFQQVFDAEPTGDLADNALYWIGETYYAAGQYSEAVRYYRRVTTELGEGNKAPDALFKIALTQAKSGDLALARKTLDEVIARYPYSTAAASARAELKRIAY